NKAITLMGSGGATLSNANKGTDATTQINNGSGRIISVTLPSASSNQLVRISGIFFDCVNWANPGSTAISFPTNSKVTSFRIDHCKFNKGSRTVYPQGWN